MTTHAARVLADSVSPAGHRLTTLEVVFPRIVLAEFNTHRMLSRNSASSRAIPVEKQIRRALEDPFVPTVFERNRRGMQGGGALDGADDERARAHWLNARDAAVRHARDLAACGVHKGYANRVLEPFLWHTCVVSATTWSNFLALRCHPDAHPDIRLAAEAMRDALAASEPHPVNYGEWHLPLVEPGEAWDEEVAGRSAEDLARVAVGRCGRVSYLTHDGRRDPGEDLALEARFAASHHMSPEEHAARPMTRDELVAFRRPVLEWLDRSPVGPGWRSTGESSYWLGNFEGWVQRRKLLPYEHDFSLAQNGGPK